MYDNNNQSLLKTLILGGSGKIGASIRQLIDHDKIDCPTRFDVDLSKPHLIERLIDWNKYKAIIYCAGINGRQILDVEPKYSESINIESPLVIAKIAASRQIRFCYISSDDVFDGSSNQPYSEFDDVNPLNRYGEEKHRAEVALIKANPNAVIARLPMIYGGAIEQKNHVQFLDKIIASALEGSGSWSVSSLCVTNPSWLEDVLPIMLSLTADLNASGIFHICNSEGLSLYDFATEITSTLQSDTIINGVKDTFSTPEYKKKAFSPLISKRSIRLRSCKEALHTYLRKREQTVRPK